MLSLILLSLAAPCFSRTPVVPTITYLYSVNLTMPTPLQVGISPLGKRTVYRMTGGTFDGPKLKGTVLMGLDWGLTDTNATYREDTVYFLQTEDGANIMVTAKGLGANVHHTFETGDPKYSWLNYACGYAVGYNISQGVGLDVYQLAKP
ncbi:hypothetical protein CONLIGDRAFT_617728 [Coniochaeta ligniaria NRRL 30616]|uniref:Uncharacterized protein n=1 Tax=Coniochaeta ligniaria NRRL 30616 TaxID=1408157 RepID=A0A1J7IMQ9_9PEZI|nr:hypothetical protein CONLIGDRAFT_617728 [Coniochaeta ligniaria NRRL 30616]